MKKPLFEIEVSNVKPLSVNAAWQGRRFKTPEYNEYEKEWSLLLRRRNRPIEGLVEVEYVFHLVNCARTDVDNLIKPLQDILVKRGYLNDDRQIRRVIAEKRPHSRNCVYISIRQYHED